MTAKRAYWLITTEYPPLYGGGIGTYCFQNAQMLQQNGWDVTVFIHAKDSNNDAEKNIDGIRVIEFVANRTSAWNFLGYETALAYEFAAVVGEYLQREGCPLVLESQEYAGIAYYILQYKHLGYPLFKDLRVLLTLHAPSFLYYDYNRVPSYQLPYFWIGEMERWCMVAADVVNAPSRFMTQVIKPYFRAPLEKEVEVIPYPYERGAWEEDFERDPREQWYFFGKLTPQKGIIPLLEAFRRLWNDGWQKDLNIIGGGDHYYHPENISMWLWIKRKYAHELQSKKLRLLGNLPPKEWNKMMAAGSVIIIPSIGDNYPFTVLESLTNGQVVLASKQGGQSELILHGENGFLFDHNIRNDLEQKVRDIANAPVDSIRKIRKNAISTVRERHAYSEVYPLKEKLLLKLIAQPQNDTVFPFIREMAEPPAMENEHNPFTRDLLSIVIPYYNMGDLIEETLCSIRETEYNCLEIIVVDDGSDKTNAKKLEALRERYLFSIIRQVNQGLATARNTGAKAAKGEFIAFIDADDKVHTSYYRRAIEILRSKKNVSFVGSWVQYFENSKGIWPAFTPEPPYILYYNMVCSGGLVYKTDDFLQAGWNDPVLEYGLEDWDSVISLIKEGRRGVVIPEPLYYYRIRKGSMARRFTPEKLLYSTSYISRKHEDFYAKFAPELSSLYNANGPGFKIDNPTLDYKNYGMLPEWLPFLPKMVTIAKSVPIFRKYIFKIHAIIKNYK